MKVIELFLSVNGEGLKSGELATFVRFAGCNLRCPYCDTKYSYENPKYIEMSIDEIISKIESFKAYNVTLTGGEPLIQKDIDILIKKLSDKGYRVELETNGSVDISKYVGDVFVGIDAGSTTCKVVAIGNKGELLYENYQSTRHLTPKANTNSSGLKG